MRLAMILLCAWVVAGCAPTTGYSWLRSNGQSEQQLAADKLECAKVAVDPLKIGGYLREVYILCMEAKGYTRLVTFY